MTLEILIVLLLIVVQGVFAMGEMAIVSARKARLKQMADEGSKGAAAALALAEHPSRFFSTIQIGLTLCNIVAGAYGGVKVADSMIEVFAGVPSLAAYAEPLAFGSVVVVITFLTLILGELVPKRLAVSRPEAIAAGVGRGMALLSRVAAPIVWFLSAMTELVLKLVPMRHGSEPAVTDEEVKLLMEQGTLAGHFHPAEKTIVDMALRLGDRRVSALMTPRPQVEWLDLEDAIEETKQKVLGSHYSRFPVAEGGRRHIVGVVEVKDLLASELAGKGFDIRGTMRPPLYIPDTAPALKALESFRRTGAPIALIVDEYGDFQGIVTLEDLLEALVGDLPEPGQAEEPAVTQRADGSWLVDGMLPIDQLKDAVGMARLPDEEEATYQTVAGLVMDQLRRIPKAADWFDIDDYRFEVVDMDGRRIDKVMVSRRPPAPDEESASRPAA
ncbi:MAG TPA: hemolysin family protein [Candidatus Acidoferrum sp.]|nr:hemolysin family protein [Candidatus Acidoferrum sp.]